MRRERAQFSRLRGLSRLEALVTDLRYALRTLRADPGFSVIVLVTLALGIGATAAMFTILNAVILRPLPYPDADRIVSLSVSSEGSDPEVTDDRSYLEWTRSARSVDAMAAYGRSSAVMRTTSGPQRIDGTEATASYFEVLGVSPLLGRLFTEDESRPGGPPVILLGERLWRTSFGGDRSIVGRTVSVERTPVTVIGILPESFTTPDRAQFWIPRGVEPPHDNATFYYSVLARLRRGASVEMLRSELTAIQRRLDQQRGGPPRQLRPVVMTLHERLYGDTHRPVLLLFAAVGVLLVITCANVANLSLARAARREQQFTLRLVLGAGRRRLVRYVLLESFVLAAGGALLGLLLAASALGYFVRLSPASVGNPEEIRIDGTVLLFTIGVTLLATLLFGLVPALSAGRSNLNASLGPAGGRIAGSRAQRVLRRTMVVLELAIALVLVVGAGLVARTFWTVTSIRMGFEPEHVLTVRADLPWDKYTDTTARRFMEELLTRVGRQPGVHSASLADALPLTRPARSVTLTVNGKPGPRYDVVHVTPGYFATLGTRIVEGRAFELADPAGGAQSAVVSATLARALFRDRSAVGERLGIGVTAPTIVGVAEDVRQWQLEAGPPPVAFVPMSGSNGGSWRHAWLAIRTTGPPTRLVPAVTRTVQELDPAQPPPRFRAMQDFVAEVVAPRKFIFVLLGIFAGLAGTLAVIGLYGVLSYLVVERTKEIGIRAALGADPGKVMRLMLGQGMGLVAIGVAAGLGATILAVRLLEKMVYEMSVYDAWTFTAAALLLTLASVLATYLPARRASRVDPVIALRAE